MKSSDIIMQLSAKLPALVDDFTTSFDVISLIRSGTTVTVTTSTNHGLTVNKSVNIVGAKTPITISSITRVGIVATLVTAADHDMTEGAFTQVEISGATEAEFNGTFTLLNVKNRRTITFMVADSGPLSATGAPLLLNGSSPLQSYNGLKKVATVPTADSFTYEVSDTTLFPTAAGTITAKTKPRISGAVDDERALQSYTRQNTDEAWLYVTLGDSVASKSRRFDLDGTDNISRTSNYKQFLTQLVSLFVFIPASGTISGRKARDRAEELFRPICQSILFAKFDSLLAAGSYNPLMFNEHGVHGYNKAFYIHRYTFELTSVLTVEDTVGGDEDVAFRDIFVTQNHDIGTGEITSDIDLDDEPL